MKPVAQPNLLYQTMMGFLLDNKQRFIPAKLVGGDVVEPARVEPMLANNVSELNVERAARRWLV